MSQFLKLKKLSESHVILILSIFYLFGIFFHLWFETREIVIKLTEVNLFVFNIIIILYLAKENPNKRIFFLWLALTVFFTLIVEILGVYTGEIFGSYHYGETMKVKIGGVPIIIGVNWAILISAAHEVSKKIISNKSIIPLITAFFISIFDFVMEPIAMRLDYWQWANNSIPNQNYLVWFILGGIFSYLLIILKVNTSSKILLAYFLLQFLFFLVLNIFIV